MRSNILDDFEQDIEPEKGRAQILIENGPSPSAFDDARRVIEDSGALIDEVIYLLSRCILLKLDILDRRSIVLKLTEKGFTNIRGVNAINLNI
jgi:hypothetical protein